MKNIAQSATPDVSIELAATESVASMPQASGSQVTIDQCKIGRFQILIFSLCSLCVILDGFDVQAIGYVAPAIKQEWGIAAAQLGPVFGAGLFGMVVGSLLLSVASDRFGRRPVMIGSTIFFGVAMLITGHVQSLQGLLVMRFISGVGLGAIMPNALALTSEYSPNRHRTFLVMLMACSYSLGAAIGGGVAAVVIPEWGWRSVFLVGGIVPIVLGVFMIFLLPESLQMMVLKGVDPERISAVLRRVAPNATSSRDFHPSPDIVASENMPVIQLFKDGKAGVTLLLWLMHFMNLAVLYFLANWLPTLMKDAGLPLRTALLAGTTLQAASIIGGLFLAKMIGRFGFFRVLPANYAIGFVAIALIGHSVGNVGVLFAVIFVCGFCVIGGLNGINALATASYPTAVRSTGVGWALGVGRFGSILAPVLGGILIGMQWSNQALFTLVALPALVLAVALVLMKRLVR